MVMELLVFHVYLLWTHSTKLHFQFPFIDNKLNIYICLFGSVAEHLLHCQSWPPEVITDTGGITAPAVGRLISDNIFI